MDTKKILAVLIAIIMLITLIGPASANTKRAAKVIELSGTVHYQKGGGDRQLKAFKGMSLAQGDRLITGKDGKATLEIDNDKKVTIGPNSNVDLSQLSGEKGKDENTRLNLRRGEIVSEIGDKLNTGSRFEIKTPTAVMGVRGTWFTVSHQNNGTYIAVIEGSLYALSTTPGEDADRLSAFLEENEQLSLADLESLAAGVTAEPLALEDLPLTALEELQTNTDKLPPALKEQVEKEAGKIIADKKEQQQAAADQQAAAEGQLAGTSPGIEPTTPATPPAPSGGGGGGGDTGGTQPPRPPDPPVDEPKLSIYPDELRIGDNGLNLVDPILPVLITLDSGKFDTERIENEELITITYEGSLDNLAIEYFAFFDEYGGPLESPNEVDCNMLGLSISGTIGSGDDRTITITIEDGGIKDYSGALSTEINIKENNNEKLYFFNYYDALGALVSDVVVELYEDGNETPILSMQTDTTGTCWGYLGYGDYEIKAKKEGVILESERLEVEHYSIEDGKLVVSADNPWLNRVDITEREMQEIQSYFYPSALILPSSGGSTFTTEDTLKAAIYLQGWEFYQDISIEEITFEGIGITGLDLSVVDAKRPENNIRKLELEIIGTIPHDPSAGEGVIKITLPATATTANVSLSYEIPFQRITQYWGIAGNVVYRDGGPVESMQVFLYKLVEEEYVETGATEVTDNNGRYEILRNSSNLDPGTYKVVVELGEEETVETVEFEIKNQPMVIELPLIEMEMEASGY